MVKIVLKCIALWILAFLCNSFYCEILGTSDTYLYSNENVAFMLFISIVLSIKYDILKMTMQVNNKLVKGFLAIICIALFFVGINYFYTIVPMKFDIENLWNEFSFKRLIFLPEKYIHLNISLITGLDVIFSIIIIAIEYARMSIVKCDSKALEGNRAKRAYTLEKIVKFYCKYNFIVIFTVNLLLIPKKYIIASVWSNLGVVLLLILHFALAIYIIESLYIYSEINKSKCGKQNLIIVLTMHNYKMCFYNKLKGSLFQISKMYSKSIFKNTLISSRDYTFVNYEAIRYNLVDIKKYKKVSYLVLLDDSILGGGICGFRNAEFIDKLEQIEENGDNFIIYSRLNRMQYIKFSREINKRYRYRIIEKMTIDKIVNASEYDSRNEELKSNAEKILHYMSEKKFLSDDKNKYIEHGLNNIIDSFCYEDYFNTLLNIGEYVVHYMALRGLIRNKNKVTKEEVSKGNIGEWINCIIYDKEYSTSETDKIIGVASRADVIESIVNVNTLLNKDSSLYRKVKGKYYFKEDVCEALKTVKEELVKNENKVDFDLREIVYDLFNIIFSLVYEFEELNASIQENEEIKDVFSRPIDAIIKEQDRLFLYTENVINIETQEELRKEYYNYETGRYRTIGSKIVCNLNHRWSENEVKKMAEKMG